MEDYHMDDPTHWDDSSFGVGICEQCGGEVRCRIEDCKRHYVRYVRADGATRERLLCEKCWPESHRLDIIGRRLLGEVGY